MKRQWLLALLRIYRLAKRPGNQFRRKKTTGEGAIETPVEVQK